MIILSTGSLYNYGIARVFALAAETGYDGVEVLIDARWDSRDPSYLRRLSSDYDLPIAVLHCPFVNDVDGWPRDQLGRLERTVALAQELDVSVVVAHLPFRFCAVAGQLHFFGCRCFLLPLPWPRMEPYYYFLRDGRLQEMESSTGVIVAMENMPARRLLGFPFNPCWFNHPEKLMHFRHLTLDTTHFGTWGLNPIKAYERLRDRIVHVHLSNFDGQREHLSPPDGRLPLASLLNCLAHRDYAGAVSVESAPDALEADDEGKCRRALERALAFCRKHFAVGKGRMGEEVLE